MPLDAILGLVEGLVGIVLANPAIAVAVLAVWLIADGFDVGIVETVEGGLRRVTDQPGGEGFVAGAVVGIGLGIGGASPMGLVEAAVGLVMQLLAALLGVF